MGLVRAPSPGLRAESQQKCSCLQLNTRLAILAAQFTVKASDNDALIRSNSRLTAENIELMKELEQLKSKQTRVSTTQGDVSNAFQVQFVEPII